MFQGSRMGRCWRNSVPRICETRGWHFMESLLGTSHAVTWDSPETRKLEKEKFGETEKRERGFLICTHRMRAVLQLSARQYCS